MLRLFKIGILLLSLAALCGCGKANYNTDFTIRPRIRRVESSPDGGEPAYQMRAYAWYIAESEQTQWMCASWDDAQSGIITNRLTGEQRVFEFLSQQPDFEVEEGEQVYDPDTYIHFDLTRSYVFLLAVDPLNRFYAYRYQYIPKPMPYMEITLMLQLWRTGTYEYLKWTIVNADRPEPETYKE